MESTSFPPPDYIPADSAVEGIEVFKPAPLEKEEHKEVVDFKCPQCGGSTAFSVVDGGLTCTHCGYYESPRQPVVGKGAQEFEFTVETVERSTRGWGQARKELVCRNCGAHTSISTDTITHRCPFCGSAKVIQREADQEVLRPRFLIPFKIEIESCPLLAREELSHHWMTPGALRRQSVFSDFSGVFVPFWTFDSITKASWKAEVGHTKTERYFSDGKWKTRTKTVWKWESGKVRLDIDDLLVVGTQHLSRVLLGRIDHYNLRQLAPYEAAYLAGFHAKAYDIPLEAGWEKARHQMREQTRQACRDQASTSQIRNFSMSLDFGDETWRYTLLPLYIANYQYEGQSYQVMVNGQTGDVSGQRPVAWLKVWLAVGAALTPGIGLGLLGILTLILAAGVGILIGTVAFILLVIGIIIAYQLVRHAQELDDA